MAKNGNGAKQKKSTQVSEDRSFYKILTAFMIAAVVEILFVTIYRKYYTRSHVEAVEQLMAVIKFVLAALCVMSAVSAIVMRKRRNKMAPMLGAGAVLALLLAASAWLLESYAMTAAKLLCVLCPIVLLLYIVFIIYQREFFLTSVLCALCLLVLWVLKNFSGPRVILAVCLAAAAAVLIAVMAVAAGKKDGKIKAGPVSVSVYELQGGKVPLLISCTAVLLVVFGTFIFAAVAEMATICVAAYLFVMAVYYTVKLM